MKLLKIFGIVAGIHVFALVLIFANPGCSSLSKSTKTTDGAAATESTAVVSVPNLSNQSYQAPANDYASTQINAFDNGSPITAAPVEFNPDSPAVTNDGRFRPTRPNTTVATALKSEPVKDVVPVSTYTVVSGDSLWSIAKRNHLSVSDLAESNNLRASSVLKVGQKLIIPGESVKVESTLAATEPEKAEPKKAAPPVSKETMKHVVASGETLGGIARKYGVSVGTIATANSISDPAKIRPGQELIIPGWKKPAAEKPAPAVVKRAPAPLDDEPPVIKTDDNPFQYTPPSADKPLDQGIQSNASEAPVIQVEESE